MKKPHIYLLRGKWTCARLSDLWCIWPYGKGSTPRAAYLHWQCLMVIEKISRQPQASEIYSPERAQ
jgi:hypothetical protein